jgi:hypothetical protein
MALGCLIRRRSFAKLREIYQSALKERVSSITTNVGHSPAIQMDFALLQMKLPAAPVFGSNVSNGFREVPAVAVEILGVVLALAIRMVCRFRQDNRPILPRSLTMALRILDTDLHALGIVRQNIPFSDREATLAGLHLDAVIGDAQSNRKAKRPPQRDRDK